MKRPWMPLYIADFLKDTTHIGATETGAYLLLIMHYWQNEKLPDDDRQLARIAKLTPSEFKRHRKILNSFFYEGWKHKRIDQELSHAFDVSNKRSAVAAARQAQIREQNECKDSAIAPAIADTLHTTQRKEEAATAATPLRYAFESGVIKLNQKDFDQWTRAFVYLNLPAKLLALTEWAGQQRSWFNAVASALAKADAAAKLELERSKPAPFKYNGMEGVI